MKASVTILGGVLFMMSSAVAQVKIGDPTIPGAARTPHASAMLEVESTNRGFLPPRISLTGATMQFNGSAPAEGSIVFNTNGLPAPGLSGVGLYNWHDGKWNKMPDTEVLRGTGFAAAGLAANQTVVTGTKALLVSASTSNTIPVSNSANTITLKAGGTYRLRATGSLIPGNSSTYAYMAWRETGTASFVGHQGLWLTEGYGGGYSSGADAVALVTVGNADISYELYCREAGNANVILDSRTLDVAVDQLGAVDDTSPSTSVSFGFRNKIINGNFNVNQRERSGTVTLSANTYGHDRWRAGASGCTYTFSTTAGITTLNITAGTLQQVVEGINLETGIYTLSWTGTAQGKIASGNLGNSGVTGNITGGSNATVEFGTGTLSKVQLEASSNASTFEFRPYAMEERLCMRYFEKFFYEGGEAAGTGTPSGHDSWLTVMYKVTKMRPGTLTENTGTATLFRRGTSGLVIGRSGAYVVLRSGGYIDAEIY